MSVRDAIRRLRRRSARGRYAAQHLTPDLAVGAHPRSPAEVESVAAQGFASILNVAREGEPGQELSPNVEATWAHAFDLEHRRASTHPVPTEDEVETFLRELAQSPRPVLVHSTHGRRAAALAALALALEEGRSAQSALAQVGELGLEVRDPDLQRCVVAERERRARERRPPPAVEGSA